MLAGKITRKQFAWGYLFVIPAYLYYIPTLVSHFIYQLIFLNVMKYDATYATILLNFLSSVVICFILFILLRKYIAESIKVFASNLWKNLGWTFSKGILITYGLSMLGALIIMLVLGEEGATNGSSNQQLFESLQSSGPVFMFVQAVVLAPIIEELIFRGIIFRSLTRKNMIIAHILSALSFGLVHVYSYLFMGDLTQLVYMIMYALMGFGLSFSYQKRGTIIVPILLHAINNAVAFIASSFL